MHDYLALIAQTQALDGPQVSINPSQDLFEVRQPDKCALGCRQAFQPGGPRLWADDMGGFRQLASILVGREKNIQTFDMYVGINNLEVASKYTQWFEVNLVIIHPTYRLFHPSF